MAESREKGRETETRGRTREAEAEERSLFGMSSSEAGSLCLYVCLCECFLGMQHLPFPSKSFSIM